MKQWTVTSFSTDDGKVFSHEWQAVIHEKMQHALSFEVNSHHIKAAQRFRWFVDYSEVSGYLLPIPAIPYKSPWGDGAFQVYEILGLEKTDVDDDGDSYYDDSPTNRRLAWEFMVEMKVVMEIFCETLSLKEGTYERHFWQDDWRYKGK